MVHLQCRACGGRLKLNYNRTLATCEYCEGEYLIDYKGNSTFDIIAAETEEEKQERAALYTEKFQTSEGKDITVKYLYHHKCSEYDMYVAENNILYLFNERNKQLSQIYANYCGQIQYVDSRMESKMKYYLPEIVGTYDLKDGSVMIVIKKLKWTYPLNLVGELEERHMAWIVSRLENLACLLEYNHMSIHQLSSEDIFVDPKNHQVLLYGGWHKASTSGIQDFLRNIRKIAGYILKNDSPEDLPKDLRPDLRRFIQSDPKENSTKDFEFWDKCLLQAFGERKFIHLNLLETNIYNKKQNY